MHRQLDIYVIILLLVGFGGPPAFAEEPTASAYPCLASKVVSPSSKTYQSNKTTATLLSALAATSLADNDTYLAVCMVYSSDVPQTTISAGTPAYLIDYSGTKPLIIDGFHFNAANVDGPVLILQGTGPVILRNITIDNIKQSGILVEGQHKTLQNITLTGTQMAGSIGIDLLQATDTQIVSGAIAGFATGLRMVQSSHVAIGNLEGAAEGLEIRFGLDKKALPALPGEVGVVFLQSYDSKVRAVVKHFANGVQITEGAANHVDGAEIVGLWPGTSQAWTSFLAMHAVRTGVQFTGSDQTLIGATVRDFPTLVTVQGPGHQLMGNTLTNTAAQASVALAGVSVDELHFGTVGEEANTITNVSVPFAFPPEDRPEALNAIHLDFGKACKAEDATVAHRKCKADEQEEGAAGDAEETAEQVVYIAGVGQGFPEDSLARAWPIVLYSHDPEANDATEYVQSCTWAPFGVDLAMATDAPSGDVLLIPAATEGLQCQNLEMAYERTMSLYILTPTGAYPLHGDEHIVVATLDDLMPPPTAATPLNEIPTPVVVGAAPKNPGDGIVDNGATVVAMGPAVETPDVPPPAFDPGLAPKDAVASDQSPETGGTAAAMGAPMAGCALIMSH